MLRRNNAFTGLFLILFALIQINFPAKPRWALSTCAGGWVSWCLAGLTANLRMTQSRFGRSNAPTAARAQQNILKQPYISRYLTFDI